MLNEGKKPYASPSIGVYCLANDAVIEWFQMFVRSFRHFNPRLPLTVIPYNTEVSQLKQLAAQFDFQLLPESAVAPFDALEPTVMQLGVHAGMFRKWASFFGDYDEFIFFDADIAVTLPLDEIFCAFAQCDRDFLYFDTDITMVYEPEFVAEMQAGFQSPGFNAGAYVSRKGVVSRERLWQKAAEAAAVRKMFRPIQDQPFLNYLMDTLPRRIAHVNTLLPKLSLKPWARARFQLDAEHDRMLDAEGRLMPFIHWAGCGYPTMVRPEIFLKFRTLGMTPIERMNYQRKFYRLRFQKKLKARLLKSKLFGSLLAARDRRTQEKQRRALPLV